MIRAISICVAALCVAGPAVVVLTPIQHAPEPVPTIDRYYVIDGYDYRPLSRRAFHAFADKGACSPITIARYPDDHLVVHECYL